MAVSPPANDEVDAGVFVWLNKDAYPMTRETFSVRRSGDHLVLYTAQVSTTDPKWNHLEGELEVDRDWRPVRADYVSQTPEQEYTYRLAGSPATLDVTRNDDRDPEHVVAPGPLDVYVAGPGLVAMTPLCRVRGEAALPTIDQPGGTFEDFVLAYEAAPVGAHHRVVVFFSGFDLELVCDGDQIVAGAIGGIDYWILREGREADLAALREAPRATPRKWVHPVVESAPWDSLDSWVVDGKLLVSRDARKWQTRLTAYDASTGAELVHRDFDAKFGVLCEPGKGTLLCEIENGEIRVLDARTLTDILDVTPLLAEAANGIDPAFWNPIDGDLVELDDDHVLRVDVAKRTVKPAKRPEHRTFEPSLCARPLARPLTVGKTEWTIVQKVDKATLQRRKGKTELAPIEMNLYYPWLAGCGPKYDQPYAVSNDSDEHVHVIAAMRTDGTVSWTSENLVGHISQVRMLGGRVVVATDSEARRFVAFDPATGAVVWTATGPHSN